MGAFGTDTGSADFGPDPQICLGLAQCGLRRDRPYWHFMTGTILGFCCGVLAALVAILFVLHRRKTREAARLQGALSASVSWWWQAGPDGRIRWAQAGRRPPPWLDTRQLIGRELWQIPGAAQEPAPAEISTALARRLPFFDVAIAAQPPAAAAAVQLRLSAVPRFGRLGRYCGHAGSACLLDDAQSRQAAPGLTQRLAQMEQERTEQTRRFELAAGEMESFSYSVSHDLRSPLRVVDGFAAILLEDYGARLDELGREHLRRIATAAARMNAMIDALLSMSRRTGRELQSEAFDLSRAAHELADELHAGDLRRAVEFRIEPGLRTRGDPVLLRLVLQNLLGNAFKFSAHAPQGLIEFGQHVVDGTEVFFVRDNGAGFDMRYADRLFGLFQRFHPQDEFPGTGVGLATVQRIVRRHGGRIWAESAPGQGASFYFTLEPAPATPGSGAPRSAPRNAPAASS